MFDSARRRVIIGVLLAATSLVVVGSPAPSGAGAADCFAMEKSRNGTVPAGSPVNQASGLVMSRQMPGVLWTHNDHNSGASNAFNNRIYALDMSGRLVATVQFNMSSQLDIVPDPTFVELEDISYGPGPGRDPNYLYLSDTGDNALTRDFASIYRFPEPVFESDWRNPTTINVSESALETTRFRYENFRGNPPTRARNVEAMFIDPGTGHLFLFEKALHALDPNGDVIEDPVGPEEYSFVHRVHAGKLFPANPATVRLAAIETHVRGKLVSDTFGILAADISADGTIIALKNADETFYWVKKPDDSVLSTFKADHDAPCQAPFDMAGEGLTISPTSDSLVAIREGPLSPIWIATLLDQEHICFGRPATHVGTGGDDTIDGTAGVDVIVTYGGNDVVRGLAGADRICLGPGDDYADGGKQGDRIAGGWGYDTIEGSNGKDILRGGDGRDTITGNAQNDRIYGGDGKDTLGGGSDVDTIYGEAGSDRINGWTGGDTLVGGAGGDTVDGGGGNDSLSGGSGDDSCEGGAGTDSAIGCEDVSGVP